MESQLCGECNDVYLIYMDDQVIGVYSDEILMGRELLRLISENPRNFFRTESWLINHGFGVYRQ